MQADYEYKKLCTHILENGEPTLDRTGVGTISCFGGQSRYDLTQEFPLLTTKKVHWKSVVGELLWFLSGSTDANQLRYKYGVTIWDEWRKNGSSYLGPIYGYQWRKWMSTEVDSSYHHDEVYYNHIDQITNVIKSIKEAPNSRRHIVSAWNVADLDEMALPPCHMMFQFYVRNGELSCHMYQRSADIFLGVPFNIASYALLTHMIAHLTNLKPKELLISYGDVHIYSNHMDQIKLQLSREPMPGPKLFLSPGVDDIDKFTMGDIVLIDYVSHPSIKGAVSV